MTRHSSAGRWFLGLVCAACANVLAACAGTDAAVSAGLPPPVGVAPVPVIAGAHAAADPGANAAPVPSQPGTVIVEPGPGSDGGAGCVKDVDLVFVMDISGSMLPFFEQLDSEILVVDQTLSSLSLPHAQRYGLVVFVDDVEVTNEGAAYDSVEQLRQAFIRWRTAAGLDQIKVPQFNGSFIENSLDALHAAATRFQWRDAASTHRMIVHVTDDTFWDGPAQPGTCEAPARNGCATVGSAHGYREVVELLRAQKIWTHAFAAQVRPLSFGFVGTGAGFFEPWKGAPAIPEATGGQAWEILDVLLGSASLSESINAAVLGKRCETYPPPLL